MDASAQQVNNGGCFIKVEVLGKGLCRGIVHTKSIKTTCTEHLCITEVRHAVRNIDKHIATMLSTVVFSGPGITCTSTIGMEDIVLCMVLRTDIHKGTLLLGHRATCTVKLSISIVIRTIATTKDRIDTSLQVLHV